MADKRNGTRADRGQADLGRTRRARRGRIGFVIVLGMLAGLTVLTVTLLYRELTRPAAIDRPAVADLDARSVTVDPPWLRPETSAVLTRIAVGSCLHQTYPMPIIDAVMAARPDVFLMIGDNVYGDRAGSMAGLYEAYAAQAVRPEMTALRRTVPVLATWDDHDYGPNDGDERSPIKEFAGRMFAQFWQMPDAVRPDGGIYYARTYGVPGRRVQVVMLDTRWFRSPFNRSNAEFPYWGPYRPDPDPDKTMLGDAQWRWLEAQLREPADIRIIVSGSQVLAQGHGFERWGNLPAELKRLETLLARTDGPIVLLSGDRHSASLYRSRIAAPGNDRTRALLELTASSLNRSYGPSRDGRIPPLVGEIHHQENFGMVEIDWAGRQVTLTIRDVAGTVLETLTHSFDMLGAAASR